MIYINNHTDKIEQSTAIALGKFDGLHIGHQLLLDEIVSQKDNGLLATVFTFDQSPLRIISGATDGYIDTRMERLDIMKGRQIDALVEYPFTKEFAKMEPDDFVCNVLIQQFSMKMLVVGEDFCFGRNRSGNVDLLRELSQKYNFQLVVKEQQRYEDAVVSSTLIKQLISKGDMKLTNQLLNRCYSIRGEVVSGNKLGRTIQFPTANIEIPDDKLVPPYGVYHVKTIIDGCEYDGVANLGTKPTVKQDDVIGLETHILNYSGDLYGKHLKIDFLDFIRPEMRFSDVEALKTQIKLDIEKVMRA